MASSAAPISSETEPRSRPTRLAVITATRSPSLRRISAGPSTSWMSATADSGIAVLPTWKTVSRPRSSTLSR